MEGKRSPVSLGLKVGGGVITALAVAAAVAFGVHIPGRAAATSVLDPALSLSEGQSSQVSFASQYQQESLDKFADIMHVEDGEGNLLSLDEVPGSDYSGFLFQLAPAAGGAGDASAKAAEALEQGLIRQVHDGLYTCDSLDVLASLFSAEQLDYIEPDFNIYLIGEVGDKAADDLVALELPGSQDAGLRGGTAANPTPDWPPNDQQYLAGKQWNLDMLNIQGAWAAGLDGDPYVYNSHAVRDTPVRVAVIDTGMYGTGASEPQHEDFDYSKVEVGYDFIHNTDESAPDVKGHGTFCAGLIAAQAGNETGIAGAMPGVVIVAEKVFDTGSASTANVVAAIYHAVDEAQVDVISMSLGGSYNDSSLETACDYAVAQGVLVVASAGNDGTSTPNYPAAYSSVVGVASVNSSQVRSSWSQYGRSVFVTAPGESVTSTYIEGADSYYTGSGTSFSGPMVAALAAMCRSVYPDMDQDVFKQFLIETSTDLGDEGFDEYYGYGLVDFEAMAQAVLSSQVLPWYNVAFNVVDAGGAALTGATIRVTAAEDISWEANPEEGYEAGTIPAGTEISPDATGAYKVHRGLYDYTVICDGYYTVSGSFKTYAENQVTKVTMPTAFAVTVHLVDSSDNGVEGATLAITSGEGRAETPKTVTADGGVYDLASGAYGFSASAEGYEPIEGSFIVQHSAQDVKVVLYRADELSTVGFSIIDADDGRALSLTSVAVYDASGMCISPQAGIPNDPDDPGDPGAGQGSLFKLAKGGSYTAVVSKVGYEDRRQPFQVGADDSQIVTVSLTKASSVITFNVMGEDGQVIGGFQVRVASEDGRQAEPQVGNPHKFNLNPGTYTYEVSASGYETVSGRLSVTGTSYTLNITLKAIPHKLSFAVTDADTGEAITGFSAKVSRSNQWRAITPNTDGTYTLTPGDYTYTVFAQGYKVASADFQVAADDLVLDVALTRKPDTATEYAGGSGTEEDPYLIATEEQLRYLAGQTEIVRMTSTSAPTNQKGTVGGYYRLVDDIQLAGGEWLPIGNFENSDNYVAFIGDFDGAGHTVSGVQIDTLFDAQGFFGYVCGAHIHDLTIEGTITSDGKSSTSGGCYVGGIVGRAYAGTQDSYAPSQERTIIERCCNRARVTGRYAVGGIVGSAYGSIQGSATGVDYDLGASHDLVIRECCNKGNVSAALHGQFLRQSSAAGGIVGSCQLVTIADCYNVGNIEVGYNAGGLVGRGSYTTVFTSYSSGRVVQHVSGAGYSDTAGSLIGTEDWFLVSDCHGLNRSDSSRNVIAASPSGYSDYRNCSMLDFGDMYRNGDFVSTMNTNSVTGDVGSAFIFGRDYPLLYWEVAGDAVLAATPHIVLQPVGIDEMDAYRQGEQAQELVSEIDEIADGGTVTWQWFASDYPDGSTALEVEGAYGNGSLATLTPNTNELGVRYYFVVFTNTVGLEMQADSSSAPSDIVPIYVRSAVDAQVPEITKLNPNNSEDIVTSLTVTTGADLDLSVTASVGDGGELSYQWYQSSRLGGTAIAIPDATEMVCAVDTSVTGSYFYYVVVTNRTGYGNYASTTSDWITVTVRPYQIGSYQELVSFRDAVNGGNTFEGQTVNLVADIRIPDGVDWEPIGTLEHPFMGVFMGDSGTEGTPGSAIATHTISNINIDGEGQGNCYLGLFGVIKNASIYDLQVQGVVSGAINTHTGLLVGATLTTSSEPPVIANCATLSGSSVEGKYRVGGLVGYCNNDLVDVANHAQVNARAYVPTDEDRGYSSDNVFSVGGVVGCLAYGYIYGGYNTGDIIVDEVVDSGTLCATRVGGVAGFTSAYSATISAFGAGALTIPTIATTQYQKGVLYSGAVVGYAAYDQLANCYYQEGTWNVGSSGSDRIDAAEMRSPQFMKTDYFVDLLNTGSSYYSFGMYATSINGVPHFIWEADSTVDDGQIASAEPYITDLTCADDAELLANWGMAFYQNVPGKPMVIWADTPDGGSLRYEWKYRIYGSEDEDEWTILASGTMTPDEQGRGAQAPVSVDVSTMGTYEYGCWIYNRRADANTEPLEECMFVTGIKIEIKDSSGIITLRHPLEDNSKDNPWIIDTPAKMKFFADVVNSDTKYAPIPDPTFTGQYVELAADIDLGAYENWTPVGDTKGTGYANGTFCGTFDGAGHKITGLHIDDPGGTADAQSYNALFGQVRMGTVCNLEVEGTINLSSAGAYSTAGIVGYAYGAYIHDVVNRVDVTAAVNTAGILGYGGACKVIDCENLGTISMNEAILASRYGGYNVGGICGNMFSAGMAPGAGIYNCFNNGTVTGSLWDGDYCLGAILGRAGNAMGTAYMAHNYYRAGCVVLTEPGEPATAFGGGGKSPVPDAEGVNMLVESTNSPETAHALATSDGTVVNSGKWGNYSRADVGDTQDCVHLVLGDTGRALYQVQTASVAAEISLDSGIGYAAAGDEVGVSWRSKPGFLVQTIGFRLAGSGDAGEVIPLGEGDRSETPATFIMPAADIEMVVTYEQDHSARYPLRTKVLYDGQDASEGAASVELQYYSSPQDPNPGEAVDVLLQVAEGYQVKGVSARSAFGETIALARVDGLHYRFDMPPVFTTVTVELEDAGTPASKLAATQVVDDDAVHIYTSLMSYRTADLFYDTITFSGSYYGAEKPYMTYELEDRTSSVKLYQQTYSVLGEGANGGEHVFTGKNVAQLIRQFGDSALDVDAPVSFEFRDGSVITCTYGDLTALNYADYDATGQPVVKGLPVLLFFGVDGVPNANGAMGIVFGQTLPGDDNSAKVKCGLTRICVGDDIDYSQHVWTNAYGVDYSDMDAICGGTANALAGYSDLHIRIFIDGELTSETVLSLEDIEALARADRGGIQHGFYSTYLYENRTAATDGPYTDYYEGYDLFKVLQAAGVAASQATEGARVQFYQTGLNGLDKSWKTIDVSLAYLAGNGDGGPGDYSNNIVTYAGDGVPASGTLTGIRPMVAYGKNCLPLVWGSGSDVYTSMYYNYRGPLMAFLPQNSVEGGDHVGEKTCTSCYLALIDVYLPAESGAVTKADLRAAIEAGQEMAASAKESVDGTDVVAADQWVTPEVAQTLATALSTAQGLLEDPEATQEAVDEATRVLEEATAAFGAARQAGILQGHWTRLGGSDRYATMQAISQQGRQDGSCSRILLATGENYADALTASALAGAWDAPLVLTKGSSLSPAAASEIQRLSSGAASVYVLGGTGAVSDSVLTSVQGLSGVADVQRIAGASRIGTGLEIYSSGAGSWGSTCVITDAWNYPDALSVGSFAAAAKAPVFGATKGKLSDEQAEAIQTGGFTQIVVLGGDGAVDFSAVKSRLGEDKLYTRLAGSTRLETSAAIVQWATGGFETGYADGLTTVSFQPDALLSYNGMAVAKAGDFPDALASVSLLGQTRGALLLVDESAASYGNIQRMVGSNAASIATGYILGGTGAVSEGIETALNDAVS